MASTPAFSDLNRSTSGFTDKGTVKHFVAHTRPLTDLRIELNNLAKQALTAAFSIISTWLSKLKRN
jgi:hypothetical protein